MGSGPVVITPDAPPQVTITPDAAPEQPGAISRFASSFAQGLGMPSQMSDYVQGPLRAIEHPVDSAKLLYDAATQSMADTQAKGVQRMQQPGIIPKAAGALQYAEGAIPFVGPALSNAGEQFERGDVAGGLGSTAALAAPIAGPEAVGQAHDVLTSPLADSVRQALAEKIAGPVVRKTPTQTANDLKFGRNPAAAITQEPGLEGVTASGLRDGVAKRMNEIGQVMDQTLSNPQAAAKQINIEPIIDQAAQSAKSSPMAKLNPALADRIDALSDNLRSQFGSLQKNPLEATQMKRQIGDATKWTGQPFDNEANQMLVDVYRGIKDQVNDAVPEIKPFNERYADLLSAKTALDRRIAFNSNRPLSVGRAMLGTGGGALGTLAGGAAGGLGGAALGMGVDLLRSDPARIIAGKVLGNKYAFPEAPAPITPEAGPPVSGNLPGGPTPSQSPNFAYRSRDVGEQGIPASVRPQATTDLSEAQSYAEPGGGREQVTGKPQEVVRIDLSKLKEGKDYERIQRPGKPDWIKPLRPMREAEVEPMS